MTKVMSGSRHQAGRRRLAVAAAAAHLEAVLDRLVAVVDILVGLHARHGRLRCSIGRGGSQPPLLNPNPALALAAGCPGGMPTLSRPAMLAKVASPAILDRRRPCKGAGKTGRAKP